MLLTEEPVCSFYQLELYDKLCFFLIKLYENDYINLQVYFHFFKIYLKSI